MEDIVRGQMSIDDISTGTNTQQSTTAAQNVSSQEKAHEYKQRLAESVQTQSESTGRNDTAQQSANRPKVASQSSFRRNLPQEQRNNNGSTSNNDNTARSTAPEHHNYNSANDSMQPHNVAAIDNECSVSVTDSCETASATAEPKRRQRKHSVTTHPQSAICRCSHRTI